MKILIMGATGMLGHTVYKRLSNEPHLKVFGTIRSDSSKLLFTSEISHNLISIMDIENQNSLTKVFDFVKPDVVINCIGIVKQLSDAKNVLKTIPINTQLPHRLALLAKKNGARLILISTDCVFSGMKGNYIENDFPDCNDLYGRSKLLGEISNDPQVLTIRTSIIGHELRYAHGLVNWFLSQKESVQGYTNAIFSGLPTNELAQIILDCIIKWPNLYGIYHVSASPISKYELLQLISEYYKKKIEIIKTDSVKINRSLNYQKFQKATGYNPKSWPDLICSMYKFNQS